MYRKRLIQRRYLIRQYRLTQRDCHRRRPTDQPRAAGPEDILRVIDLLNGAAAFDPWLDETLDPAGCEGMMNAGAPPNTNAPLESSPRAVFFVEGALADDYLAMLTDAQWSPLFSDSDIEMAVVGTTQSVAAQLSDGLIDMIVSVLQDPATTYSHPVVADLVPMLIIILNTHGGETPIPN